MSQYRFLIVVSLAASLLMVGVGMIVPLLPQRMIELSGSMQSVGYIASMFALSYIIFQLPMGSMADRLGVKPFLVSGYILCFMSGLIFYYAGTPEMILLGRLIQGAGEAPVWALGPALLSLAYPDAKGRVIGIYNAAIHAGLTLGPLLGICFFPSAASHLPFLIFAGLCLVAGMVTFQFLPASVSRAGVKQEPGLRALLALLRLRDPQLTLIGILLYGAAYGSFISVLPAYLVLFKGFDSRSVGVFFALFYVAISVSQLIAGPLSDRYGRTLFMLAGPGIAAIGIVLSVSLPHPWIYASLTLASVGLGVFCVSSMAHLNESVPCSLKASVSAAYYLSWGIGFFIGPLLIGAYGDMLKPESGYYLLALLMAGLSGSLWMSHVRMAKQRGTEE